MLDCTPASSIPLIILFVTLIPFLVLSFVSWFGDIVETVAYYWYKGCMKARAERRRKLKTADRPHFKQELRVGQEAV